MIIRLRNTTAALLITASALCAGAREAADFFVDAPPSVINIFDRNSRLDMLDYYRSGLTTPTNNAIGGKSKITAATPALVTASVSDNTRMDLAVLRLKGDSIIAIIETVNTPIPDSSIRFYRSDWTQLPSPALPTSLDFVEKKHRKAAAADAPAFDFISAIYVPEKNVFVFTNHTSDYYVAQERPALLSVADSTLTMRYDGKKFVKAQ